MAWLDDNPPARDQFRRGRRAQPRPVIVLHTAENTPDWAAFDGGAEAVARFIRGRSDPGSYHDLVDSDSAIHLVDYANEAYQDGTGSNPWAVGISIATRADVWPLAPAAWRDGAIDQAARAAARAARWLHAQTGQVVQARRITRAQSEAGAAGFVTHGDRDPGRRTDPGAGFPWDQFLARYRHHAADLLGGPVTDPTPSPSSMEDLTVADIAALTRAIDRTKPLAVRLSTSGKHSSGRRLTEGEVWIVSGGGMYHVQRPTLDALSMAGAIQPLTGGQPTARWSAEQVASIPIIPAA